MINDFYDRDNNRVQVFYLKTHCEAYEGERKKLMETAERAWGMTEWQKWQAAESAVQVAQILGINEENGKIRREVEKFVWKTWRKRKREEGQRVKGRAAPVTRDQGRQADQTTELQSRQ